MAANYAFTLKKIFIIESLGDAIYRSMANKAPPGEARDVCLRLARNERRMKELAQAELDRLDVKAPAACMTVIVAMASMLFYIAPYTLLRAVLFRVLRRSVFSEWTAIHRARNEALWKELLAHEQLQHELLGLSRRVDTQTRRTQPVDDVDQQTRW
jgi:hypothetical protein